MIVSYLAHSRGAVDMGPARAHSCDLWPNDRFIRFIATAGCGGVGWEDGNSQDLTMTWCLELELRHIGEVNG